MLLIFTYYRRDIFAKEDYGFIKGLKILYQKKVVTDTFLQQLRAKFVGYETLLTFCL
jgi:3-methyladenine DNA glycosylase/8-oxoguanine DNA glycosylase